MTSQNTTPCQNENPDLFFPLQTTEGDYHGPAARQATAAKAACHRCPLIGACLTYALQQGIDHGIYGGMSPMERRMLRHAVLSRTA